MHKLEKLERLFIRQLDLNIAKSGARADYQSIQLFTAPDLIIRQRKVAFWGWVETDIGQIGLTVCCDYGGSAHFREELALHLMDNIVEHYTKPHSEFNSTPPVMFANHVQKFVEGEK